MIISAMGIVLLFSASHSALTVSSAPYPPFGVASVWFVGFASYLLFVGIYFTALSVAHDAELRRIIRKSVERQSGLLDSIGTSEGEYQIRKNVLSVTKKITIQQGMESSSIDEKEIKEYIDMVVTELKKKSK